MKQSELIEEIREVLDDRAIQGHDQSEQLVSDTRLVRLLNQAQSDFCLKTGHLRDSVSVPVIAGQQEYLLDVDVIRVLDCWLDGIRLAGITSLTQFAPPPRDSDASIRWTNQLAYVMDTTVPNTLRLLTVPKDDSELTLRVWRRVAKFGINTPEFVSELPEQYHHALVSFVAARVYSGHDVDIGDKGSKTQHQSDYVFAVREARRELRLLENATFGFAIDTP